MNLDNLEKIQRVETHPCLFTRIQQKIEQMTRYLPGKTEE